MAGTWFQELRRDRHPASPAFRLRLAVAREADMIQELDYPAGRSLKDRIAHMHFECALHRDCAAQVEEFGPAVAV